ncbi:hypothetical protein AMECASPLE_005621 [Ameca splendens]|uniref:Uncharacterized protein n=1 Tax=Ameca splendens TaxID=208324 RepID=A0ABV0XC76_9TELE
MQRNTKESGFFLKDQWLGVFFSCCLLDSEVILNKLFNQPIAKPPSSRHASFKTKCLISGSTQVEVPSQQVKKNILEMTKYMLILKVYLSQDLSLCNRGKENS